MSNTDKSASSGAARTEGLCKMPTQKLFEAFKWNRTKDIPEAYQGSDRSRDYNQVG